MNTGKVNKVRYREILAAMSDDELFEEGVKKIKVYTSGYTIWWDETIRQEAVRRGKKEIYQNAYRAVVRKWRNSL